MDLKDELMGFLSGQKGVVHSSAFLMFVIKPVFIIVIIIIMIRLKTLKTLYVIYKMLAD